MVMNIRLLKKNKNRLHVETHLTLQDISICSVTETSLNLTILDKHIEIEKYYLERMTGMAVTRRSHSSAEFV